MTAVLLCARAMSQIQLVCARVWARNLVVFLDLEASFELETAAEGAPLPVRSRFRSQAHIVPSRPPE